jgi:hypothetical protein
MIRNSRTAEKTHSLTVGFSYVEDPGDGGHSLQNGDFRCLQVESNVRV